MRKRRASLPPLAVADARLSARDLRVLAALSFFDNQKAGGASPERKSIAAVTGLRETRVSETTTRLAAFGWLTKVGDGGRSSPSSYTINWDHTPTETVPVSGTVYQPQTVPEAGTVLEPETVPELGTVYASETVPVPGTVSENGPSSGDGLDGNSPRSGDGLAPETVPGTGTGLYTDLKNKQIKDQIRSESVTPSVGTTNGAGSFGVADVITILVSHGMPEGYVRKQTDRDLLASWIRDGFSRERIEQACQTAVDGKRDGKPIGPRYVDQVLKNNKSQKGKTHAGGQRFETGSYQGQQWPAKATA